MTFYFYMFTRAGMIYLILYSNSLSTKLQVFECAHHSSPLLRISFQMRLSHEFHTVNIKEHTKPKRYTHTVKNLN